LDVPLGTGRFLDHYARRGLRVYGLDISNDMLRVAQGGGTRPIAMLQADTERIPLRDGAVDYVVCARLLNWVPAPVFKTILSEFCRVARCGVLIEVRVVRQLSISELARSFGLDVVTGPGALSMSIIRTVQKGVISRLRAIKRTVLRRARASDGVEAFGYVVHGVYEVDRMIADERLEIEDSIIIDQRRSYVRRVVQPYVAYVLKPGAEHEEISQAGDRVG
jgi:SAM-dependent methyltransferase